MDNASYDSPTKKRQQIITNTNLSSTPSINSIHLTPTVHYAQTLPTHTEKTKTDYDDSITGMARKWDRHFSSRSNLISKLCIIIGLVLGIVSGVWGQFLFMSSFDSSVFFDVVLGYEDQVSNDISFINFMHKDNQQSATSLFSMYLWNVTNPEDITQLGFKPKLTEVGPYGYIKHIYKYDIKFSDDDSQYVTYKQYSYFTSTPSERDCYDMHFRMDKARYVSSIADCPDSTCDCKDDGEEVVVVNAKYLQLLHEIKPAKVMGLLSRQIFDEIQDAFTGNFVVSVKSQFMPLFFTTIYEFRSCVHVGSTLLSLRDNMLSSNSEAWVVNRFISDHEVNELSIECGDINVPPEKSTFCPFGSALFIANTAINDPLVNTYLLTYNEGLIVLGLNPSFPATSPFEADESVLMKWIKAGTYLKSVSSGLIDIVTVNAESELSYGALVSECQTWDGSSKLECEHKIEGLTYYLFNMWIYSITAKNKVNVEWSTSAVNTVNCDVLGNKCKWELGEYHHSVGERVSESFVSDFLDPNRSVRQNRISLYKEDNLNSYKDIYDHCSRKRDQQEYTCPAMAAFDTLANDVYPNLFNSSYSRDESGEYDEWENHQFVNSTCKISYYIFESWVNDNEYMNAAAASWFNTRWPDDDDYKGQFTFSNLHMLGYAQWGNGIPTKLLYKMPSATNLKRIGIWRFSKKGIQLNIPEYYARALKWGYPIMNYTTTESASILSALAEDSIPALELRTKIIEAGTTFYGDGVNFSNGAGFAGDATFVLENADGDFTLPASHKFHSISAFMNKQYISDASLCELTEQFYVTCEEEVNKYLAYWPTRCTEWQTLASDPAFGIQCDENRIWTNLHPYPKKSGNLLESVITEMMWEEVLRKELLVCDDPEYMYEPNGQVPVVCSYDHGGLFIRKTAREIVFDGYVDPLTVKIRNAQYSAQGDKIRIVCISPPVVGFTYECDLVTDVSSCSSNGFMIVHEELGVVKNVTRGGWEWFMPDIQLGFGLGSIDNPVFAVYSGQHWTNQTQTASSKSGGTSSASSDDVATVNETETSSPSSSPSLSPSLSPSSSPSLSPTSSSTSSSTPSSTADTFSAEENIIFQKNRTCANRYMGGPAQKFADCEITMETGRNELEHLGRIRKYYGNKTLTVSSSSNSSFSSVSTGSDAASTGAFSVNGNIIGDGVYNNFKPEGWEGFRTYNLEYQGRLQGLDFASNSTYTVLVGDELLQFELSNTQKFDGKSPSELRWPTRYAYLDNTTTSALINLVRFEVTDAAWSTSGILSFNREHDTYGMPYSMPPGMSSTQFLSGFPTVVSTPHHYGNLLWGGVESLQFKGMDPDASKHRFYMDVEPISGRVMRSARRLQINFRVERNPILDRIISSQDRCVLPSGPGEGSFNIHGYGCFMFFPLMWYDDQMVYEEKEAVRFYEEYLSIPRIVYDYTFVSVGIGGFLVVAGVLLWLWQIRKYRVYKNRVFLD